MENNDEEIDFKLETAGNSPQPSTPIRTPKFQINVYNDHLSRNLNFTVTAPTSEELIKTPHTEKKQNNPSIQKPLNDKGKRPICNAKLPSRNKKILAKGKRKIHDDAKLSSNYKVCTKKHAKFITKLLAKRS